MRVPFDQSAALDELSSGTYLEGAVSSGSDPGLDARTRALVCIGAAISLGASTATYRWLAERALAAGATVDEVAGVLFAVAATVGAAKVVAATPRISLAIGYDIDHALEDVGGSPAG